MKVRGRIRLAGGTLLSAFCGEGGLAPSLFKGEAPKAA